ncbi:MAG TPA: 3-oxoacyl-[acyl-carrier-protein] synthase III C-terminal domain-containing protein [Pseudonocardiaceae bacterium]
MTALLEIASYLPPRRVPIEELAGRLGLSDRQVRVFRRFHGLAEVRREPERTLLDLLSSAVERLDGLRGNENRVRYVLQARGMPAAVPYPMNPVHELCERFGLRDAMAFTVTHQACATGLLAIDLAGRLLAADRAAGVDGADEALALVVAGEKTFTRFAEIVPDTSILGEGSGACLVRADGPSDRLLSYATVVRGEFDGRLLDREAYLREYPELMAAVLLRAVELAGLVLDDIGLVLPHNVNSVSWQRICRRIDYPVDRVLLENVPITGHTFTADAFINYRTAAERGLLVPGLRYLVAAAGLGATFSAMVFEH